MNCKTQDFNYLLGGNGETGIPINLRTNLQRNQIENDNYGTMKVCKHIKTCANGKFSICYIEKKWSGNLGRSYAGTSLIMQTYLINLII